MTERQPRRHCLGAQSVFLFVDDEAAIASLGQEVLTRLGYQVVVCLRSTEALETFRTASPPFDLVITDQTMPHLTGTHSPGPPGLAPLTSRLSSVPTSAISCLLNAPGRQP